MTLISSRLVSAAVLSSSSLLAQLPWSFTDETATRVVADPVVAAFYDMPGLGALGTPDESEADVAVADFDQDGREDLVCVRKAPQYAVGVRIPVLLMNENGALVDRTRVYAREFFVTPSHARDVITCDVDGDTFIDIIIANTFGGDPILHRNRGVDAQNNWLGFEHRPLWFRTEQGNGSFNQDNAGAFTPGMTTCAIGCSDVDGDGDPDIYLANYPWNNWDSIDRLLINDGNGIFYEQTSARLVQAWGTGISTGVEFVDIDNDGDQDYTLTRALGGYDVVFNDGSGFFNTRQGIPGAVSHYMHTMVDLNGDGLIDSYAVGDAGDRTSINLGAGLSWSPGVSPLSFETDLLGGNAHAYDIDCDGAMDVGVADLDTIASAFPQSCNDGHRLVLLRNRFISTNLPSLYDPNNLNPQPWNIDGVWDFAFLDIDGDGKPDMVVFGCDGITVWIQQ